MTGEEKIRKTLVDLDIYPIGEINASRIYKQYGQWYIQKFGENGFPIGSKTIEAIETLREMAEARKEG